MPTAAKLICGALMAALGWYVAHRIIAYLPPETRIGRFREIAAVLGFMVGWKFMGSRAGQGWVYTPGFGIAGAGLLVFWALVIFAGYEMTIRSLRKSYHGPMEGLQAWIEIAIDDLVYLRPLDICVTLVAGAILISLVGEAVARATRS